MIRGREGSREVRRGRGRVRGRNSESEEEVELKKTSEESNEDCQK